MQLKNGISIQGSPMKFIIILEPLSKTKQSLTKQMITLEQSQALAKEIIAAWEGANKKGERLDSPF